MKILVINYEYPPIGGGGGDVSKFLSEGYAARGNEVKVLTAHWDSLPKYEKINSNLEIYRIFCFRKAQDHCTPLQMLGFMIMGTLPALSISSKWKPDFIHAHFAIPVAPISYIANLLKKIPYIITYHGGDVPGFVPEQTDSYFKIIKYPAHVVSRRACCCVAVSEGLKDLAVKNYEKANIIYIPNGVDTNIFAPPAEKKIHSPVKIVFAGRFNPQKALHRLIGAARKLKDESVTNFIVELYGGGPLEKELKDSVNKNNLEDIIKFMGWIKRDDLSKVFADSDIFVLPSDIEGMPIACLQAMSSGLAVIGSRTMGIKEVVNDGVNGILVNIGDIDSLANAMAALIKNPETIIKMGEKSREIAVNNFSWDIIVDKYLNLMNKFR